MAEDMLEMFQQVYVQFISDSSSAKMTKIA